MSAIRCARSKAASSIALRGDDRWLTRRLSDSGLASAYAMRPPPAGFKMLRHEGKLTGPCGLWESEDRRRHGGVLSLHQRRTDRDGLSGLEGDERKIRRDLPGPRPREIAASIQKVSKTFTLQSGALVARRTGARKLALAGGLFANVRLNGLLAESLPLDEVFVFRRMGDDGLPVGRGPVAMLHARDGTETWLRHRHRSTMSTSAELRRPHR